MRRELDRAVTLFAAEQGSSLSDLDQSLDPMAPEVTDITFDYWDAIFRTGTTTGTRRRITACRPRYEST